MRMICLLLLCALSAPAWGPKGHRIVALIAEERLAPNVLARLHGILGGETLAEASTWADDARQLPNWRQSGPWHYVNIRDGQTYRKSKKERRGDVLTALERFRKNLGKGSAGQRKDALRFLIHFVADLHQPLHVGRAEDRGGNLVEVSWFGRPSNLHAVWDSGILSYERLRDDEWVRLLTRVDAAQAERWADSTPLDWAEESMALRPKVYRIGDGKLGRDYQQANLPAVRQRLAQAGVRLAAFLERALD
ncbi:MAG: S1/P1 nuclease [Bryobacterales bacterium]|nr:S1/P1 nuclease [Acidobacteriota bacterium]MCB9383073.1 S1/P1 nuclease [Bryobacterales bacterium]